MWRRRPWWAHSAEASSRSIGGAASKSRKRRSQIRGAISTATFLVLIIIHFGIRSRVAEVRFASQERRRRSGSVGLITEKAGTACRGRHGVGCWVARLTTSGPRAVRAWRRRAERIHVTLRMGDGGFPTPGPATSIILGRARGWWFQRGVDRCREQLRRHQQGISRRAGSTNLFLVVGHVNQPQGFDLPSVVPTDLRACRHILLILPLPRSTIHRWSLLMRIPICHEVVCNILAQVSRLPLTLVEI